MGKSQFYDRIKDDVLQIVTHIPEARLTTFVAIGNHLDVMPRHVAYILSTSEDEKKAVLPCYRVVGDGGALGKPKFGADGIPQAELLKSEGIAIHKMAVVDLLKYFICVEDLASGVPRQSRPADTLRRA